jgi:hypothetical protein
MTTFACTQNAPIKRQEGYRLPCYNKLLKAVVFEYGESMLNKLAGVDARYEEIQRAMADPEVAVDYEKIA